MKLALSPTAPRAERQELEVALVEPRPVRREPIPRPDPVDFSHVEAGHWGMHQRLENWARWCRGTQRQIGTPGSPMFGLYRSSDARREYGAETRVPVDRNDAQRVAKGVVHLPDKHRRAIQWAYLHPRNPRGAAQALGVTLEGLRDLVRDGRQMLINLGV
jgi:hypothetical protein